MESVKTYIKMILRYRRKYRIKIFVHCISARRAGERTADNGGLFILNLNKYNNDHIF